MVTDEIAFAADSLKGELDKALRDRTLEWCRKVDAKEWLEAVLLSTYVLHRSLKKDLELKKLMLAHDVCTPLEFDAFMTPFLYKLSKGYAVVEVEKDSA